MDLRIPGNFGSQYRQIVNMAGCESAKGYMGRLNEARCSALGSHHKVRQTSPLNALNAGGHIYPWAVKVNQIMTTTLVTVRNLPMSHIQNVETGCLNRFSVSTIMPPSTHEHNESPISNTRPGDWLHGRASSLGINIGSAAVKAVVVR